MAIPELSVRSEVAEEGEEGVGGRRMDLPSMDDYSTPFVVASLFEQRLLEALGGWPENAENDEVPGSLLHVADEQHAVPVRRPEVVDELPAHQLAPVASVAYVSPQCRCLPVDDALLVAVTAVCETLVAIPEPPRDHLEVRFRGVGFVKEARDLAQSKLHVVESLSETPQGLLFGSTKTYQRRTVVIPTFLRDQLAEHLRSGVDIGDDALVFASPQGEPLRRGNFNRRIWLPAIREMGLDLRLYDLRHTCAALLIAEGAHPKLIQSHLGHSSIQVTMDRYGHLFPSDARELAERLERVHQRTLDFGRPNPPGRGLA